MLGVEVRARGEQQQDYSHVRSAIFHHDCDCVCEGELLLSLQQLLSLAIAYDCTTVRLHEQLY